MSLVDTVPQDEIDILYANAMAKRSEIAEKLRKENKIRMQDNFWKYLNSKLNELVNKLMMANNDPQYSNAQIEAMRDEFDNLLHVVNSNTLPEVIQALFYREEKKIYIEKMKREDNPLAS